MPARRSSSSLRAQFARSILTRNLDVRKGERVMIETWTHTLPWAAAMAREARRLGARPLLVYEDEEAYWDSVAAGEEKLLGKPGKHEWAALEKSDVYVYFWGPADRAKLFQLPGETLERLQAFNEDWYDRAIKSGVRGARLEIARPSAPLASLYGANADDWLKEVAEASLVDPSTLAKDARKLAKRLVNGSRLTIRHPNGTSLTLHLAGQKPRMTTGRSREKGANTGRYGVMVTIPAGSVTVALDSSRGDGSLLANRTSYFERGTDTGARWRFKGGRLTSRAFATGAEMFEEPFKTGGKGRDRLGTLTIGLNPRVTHAPQLEDLERGTLTIAVGNNAYLGGSNSATFGSWALIGGANV
ncbi:MAG: aminopeptidase, partial [Thermoplasmata archaeon]|nr:aminopeptidase [Thermoplasmata archaeon]